MKKFRIGIWFGGCSSEYEVSLQSAAAVIGNVNRDKYDLVLIGIDRQGEWYLYNGPLHEIADDEWKQEKYIRKATISMDRSRPGILAAGASGMELIGLDGALPILHGKNGEDGTLQGVIELAGIPLAGCGVMASALCMDKNMAHKLVAAEGVKVPASILFTREELDGDSELLTEAAREMGLPVFVKPLRAGSSFGITKVSRMSELREAVCHALTHDDVIIMEEAIPGFEVGCAVMGGQQLTVGEVDEIQLSQGFFDYTEKYTLKTSGIHVPARIPAGQAEEIKRTAKKIYRALGCDFFARVDMFLTPEGEIYFNEVNTIPGFTEHSRYPNMMKAAGMDFPELVEGILGQLQLQRSEGDRYAAG